MRKIILFLFVGFFIVLTYVSVSSARRPSFVGTEGCKCHKPEIDDWKKSAHGKAFEMLKVEGRSRDIKRAMKKAKLDYKKDYSKDEKCLPCHVTGYEDVGGYENEEDTPDLLGVGCEMCHGAGSQYRQLHKEKDVNFTLEEALAMGEVISRSKDDNPCKFCHEPVGKLKEHSPFKPEVDEKYKFDFDEMVKLEKTFHKIYKLKKKRW